MPATIRWDRLSRYGMLAVLGVLMLLYVNPARNYLSTLGSSKEHAGTVRALQDEQHRLEAKKASLRNPRVLENEARRLGMVYPGERSYVIDNLPRGR